MSSNRAKPHNTTAFKTPVPLLPSSSNPNHHHADSSTLNSARNLPIGIQVDSHEPTLNMAYTLNLPSLTGALRQTMPGMRKTANQRIEEILVEAEHNSKKSANFWNPAKKTKALRLAKLYNGNASDPIIKQSVRRSLDDDPSSDDVGSGVTSLRSLASLSDLASASAASQHREPILYSKWHLESALEKLRRAAARYDEHASKRLKSFEEKLIHPDVLHDLIFRVFMVKLSLPECQAVIDHFDRDASGVLDYAEFLNCFFRIASEQKRDSNNDNKYTATKMRSKIEKFDKLSTEKVRRNTSAVPGPATS
jgi:hypothetical protein